jgi:hypothetical protein
MVTMMVSSVYGMFRPSLFSARKSAFVSAGGPPENFASGSAHAKLAAQSTGGGGSMQGFSEEMSEESLGRKLAPGRVGPYSAGLTYEHNTI